MIEVLAELKLAVANWFIETTEVPAPIMVTKPVELFIEITPGFEELRVKDPPLVELGAGIEKLASPKDLEIFANDPKVGLAFSTVNAKVMEDTL